MRIPRLVLALLLVALPACNDDKPKPADPDAELRSARARLAVLAQATANGVYDAEYRFLQLPSNTTGTIRIRQSPPEYRIDIQSRGGASYFALKTGVVSCSSRNTTKGRKRTCFLVARRGEEVPALFDPGVQRLFRDAVEDLATNPNAYLVTRIDAAPTATPLVTGSATTSTSTPSVTPSASPSALPAGECFRVERVTTSPSPGPATGFEDGTYCFAEQGVATSITVTSGTMTLVKVGPTPGADAFKPPAKIQQLPDLSATPTPSKK